MPKKLILLALICCAPLVAHATSVTVTVTDAGGQAWANGNWTVYTIPLPGWGGNQGNVQTGSMDGTGTFTVTMTPTASLAPAGIWQVGVCAAANLSCFTATEVISGSSQAITITPPAIIIPIGNGPIKAYTDNEILNPTSGVIYWNLTNSSYRLFNGSTWAPFNSGTSLLGSNNTWTGTNGFQNSVNIAGTLSTVNDSIVANPGSGATYSLSSASNASGGLTTYTGTIPGGSPITPGMYMVVTGFTNGGNNCSSPGCIVQAYNAGLQQIVLYNAGGIAETHAATATTQGFFSYPAFITSSQASVFQVGQGQTQTFSIRGTSYRMAIFVAPYTAGNLPFACGLDGDPQDACYILPISDGATGNHGTEIGAITDGTGANPTAIRLGKFGGTTAGYLSNAGGAFLQIPQEVCSGQIALSTGAINSGTRATNTLACSGLSSTTDTISCTFSGDTNGVTGYAPSASGGLSLKTWASTNTINVDQINDTGSSITPGAATINCKAIR